MMVVKLGGSIARAGISNLVRVLGELSGSFLIVPGGWVFADTVRLIDSQLGLGDVTAHEMAIAGMEMYGMLIAELGGFRKVTLDEVESHARAVLMPYSSRIHESELPGSWEVTSDAISIWVAAKLRDAGLLDCAGERAGAEERAERAEVLKVTDVDGVFRNGRICRRVRARDAAGCLDGYSAKLIEELDVRVFVCNGLVEGRVKDYIVEGRTLGTLIER